MLSSVDDYWYFQLFYEGGNRGVNETGKIKNGTGKGKAESGGVAGAHKGYGAPGHGAGKPGDRPGCAVRRRVAGGTENNPGDDTVHEGTAPEPTGRQGGDRQE